MQLGAVGCSSRVSVACRCGVQVWRIKGFESLPIRVRQVIVMIWSIVLVMYVLAMAYLVMAMRVMH